MHTTTKHPLKRKKYLVAALVTIVALVIITIVNSTELDDIHELIKQKYQVAHIDNQTLATISSEKDIVLFDVREREEYEVSHIRDAIQLDPDISASEFFKLHEDKLNNKVVVFYCSVGKRSSQVLEMLSNKLPTTGVTESYNLEGGVFKWHNDQISLVKDGKTTRNIHPYNSYWGRLIDEQESITY